MSRINILKCLLAGIALVVLLKIGIEKLIFKIWFSSPLLAGFQYYQGPEIESQLCKNSLLWLKREQTNLHHCYDIEGFQYDVTLDDLLLIELKVNARLME